MGVASFFLHPGEVLEAGIQEAHVLADDEALVLSALDYYEDDISGNLRLVFFHLTATKKMMTNCRFTCPFLLAVINLKNARKLIKGYLLLSVL